MSAQPQQAAKEVLAGEPKAAARTWLGFTALAMFVLFVIDTVLVLDGFWLPLDIQVATFIQSVNWGPLVIPMTITNVTAGYPQMLAGALAIVVLFIIDAPPAGCWSL
jgi:hypothetical protein